MWFLPDMFGCMKYIFILALACVGILFSLALYSKKTPDTIGVNNGRLSGCSTSHNCVSSQAADEAHLVDPFSIQGNVGETMDRLQKTLGEMGGTVVEATDGYIHAEFSSSFWQFKDDLECLYDLQSGVVHIRSASRVGYHDFNANRKRVEKLRKLLDG